MSVFEQVRQIPIGTRFATPAQHRPFTLASHQTDSVTFSVGDNDTPIEVPRACWDSVRDFLRGRGWIAVGQKHNVADAGTFTAFLDTIQLPNQHRHPDWGSYVVLVLEHLRIVEVVTRPTRIRLR